MKKILVVEDEETLRKALVSELESSGYEILQANNGEAGLELIKKENPDLLLTDIIMPKMDGLTMLKKAKKEVGGNFNIPTIVLTNLSDEQKLTEAMEQGIYDYLIKTDWKLQDIIEKIKIKIGE